MKQSTWNAWFILSASMTTMLLFTVVFCDPSVQKILISPIFLIMSLMAFSNMVLCLHVGRGMQH